MDLTSHLLGHTAAALLEHRNAAPVLSIGKDRFTRGDLAGVACFNFIAAARLSKALADLGAASTRQVFEELAPRELALPQIGAIALAVLGAAFEAKGLGGATPLDAWATKHRDPEARSKTILTFGSIKAHSADQRAERDEKRATKARARGRRAEAHRLRVDRFSRRAGQ